MASAVGESQSPSAASAPAKPFLLSLPSETLRAIFSYLDSADLPSLCLVSKAVRDVAVTQLYHSLSHVFMNPRDGDPLVDRLAGMLETLALSDFNYASSIKEVNLGASYALEPTVNHEFHYAHTCGKFLNTLLLAAMKKMTALEGFRWDIGVEVSPTMFEALGKASGLNHLHVRMHPGRSVATSDLVAPPPPPPPPLHHHHHHHGHGNPTTAGVYQPGAPAAYASATNLIKSQDVHNLFRTRQTFSRFQQLKTLAVLDMDTMEYISEIAQCVAQCAGTLRTLKLSFSENLATKARKKQQPQQQSPNQTGSDTTMEDEGFYDVPGYGASAVPGASAGTSNDPEVRREFLEQERALSKIFGLTKTAKGGSASDAVNQVITSAITHANKKAHASARKTQAMADEAFIKEMRAAAQQILQLAAKSGQSTALHGFDSIRKASTIYLERCSSVKNELSENNDSPFAAVAEPSIAESPAGPSTAPLHNSSGQTAPLGADNFDSHPLQGAAAGKDAADEQQKAHIMKIVDMEHPDEDGEDEGEDQQFVDPAEASETDNVRDSATAAEVANNTKADNTPQEKSEETRVDKGKEPVRPSSSSSGQNKVKCSKIDCSNERKVLDYVRAHHGLPLENLSICLIPVKTSIICRAVNVWALKHVSLLNVGAQRNFWTTLAKLNATTPLQITSIHTDNVTTSFLDFVQGLAHVKELFMFEQSSRAAVKSLAPKTTVSLSDITRKVLKTHMGQIERLIIRNDEDISWALDNEALECIVLSGAKLKELVVALCSGPYHRFIQNLSHFKSLFALHVLFVSPENCSSVLREARSSLVDTIILRRPQSLGYIGLSNGTKEPTSTNIMRLEWNLPKYADLKLRHTGFDPSVSFAIPDIEFFSKLSKEFQAGRSTLPWAADQRNGSLYDEGFLMIDMDMDEIEDVKVWRKDIWHIKL